MPGSPSPRRKRRKKTDFLQSNLNDILEVIRAVGEYVILTDSSADLTAELVAELGVEVIPLSFTM